MAGDQDQTESKKGRSSKRKPSRPKQSEFLLAPVDKMRPLHPGKRALEAAISAFAILSSSEYSDILKSFVGDEHEITAGIGEGAEAMHPAYDKLRDIAHTYWFRKRVYERKPTAEFNEELAKIQKVIARLKDSLSDAPPVVRSRLNTWLGAGFRSHLNWPGLQQDSDVIAPLSKIAIVLEELSTAAKKSFETVENDEEEGEQEREGQRVKDVEKSMSNTNNSIEKGQQRGARKKIHVTDAAAALVRMYKQARTEYAWLFETVMANNNPFEKEFVSEGAQFVWRIMMAIDPDLSMGEIGSALKKVSEKQNAMSRNSPEKSGNF
jgi:hypothetical protein